MKRLALAFCLAAVPARASEPVPPAPDALAGADRVVPARPGEPGLLRIGLSGGYFQSERFPVPGVAHARSDGRLAVAWTALPWLEASAKVGFLSNRSAATVPHLIQAVGDIELSAAASRAFSEDLTLGGAVSVAVPAGVGAVTLAPGAIGGGLRFLASFGGRAEPWGFPLALGAAFDAGFRVDRSEVLLAGAKTKPTVEQEFSLGLSRQAEFGSGLWLGASHGPFTGFAELGIAAPLGTSASDLADSARAAALSYGQVVAWRVAPGVRVNPVPSIGLEAALELGFGGEVFRGWAGVPPWAVRAGVTFAFDPLPAPPPPPEPLPAPAPIVLPPSEVPELPLLPLAPEEPETGIVLGAVRLPDGRPAADAVIRVAGVDAMPVATDAQGRFRTGPLAPGQVGLLVRLPGYRPANRLVEVSARAEANAEFVLEPEPHVEAGRLVLNVSAPDGLVAVRAALRGPTAKELGLGSGTPVTLDALAPGDYEVRLFADGHYARRRTVHVADGLSVPLEVALAPAPAKELLSARGDAVSSNPQALCAKDGTLAPGAAPLVLALADALVRSDSPRKIELHAVAGTPAGRVAGCAKALAAALRAAEAPWSEVLPVVEAKAARKAPPGERVVLAPAP